MNKYLCNGVCLVLFFSLVQVASAELKSTTTTDFLPCRAGDFKKTGLDPANLSTANDACTDLGTSLTTPEIKVNCTLNDDPAVSTTKASCANNKTGIVWCNCTSTDITKEVYGIYGEPLLH